MKLSNDFDKKHLLKQLIVIIWKNDFIAIFSARWCDEKSYQIYKIVMA